MNALNNVLRTLRTNAYKYDWSIRRLKIFKKMFDFRKIIV